MKNNLKNMNEINQFKEFIKSTFKKIINKAEITEWDYEIEFQIDTKNGDDRNEVSMGIVPCSIGRNFILYIFCRAYENHLKDKNTTIRDLCHEVAHLCARDLVDLVEQPYKSKIEVERIDELLANKIGSYIFKIFIGEKHKCQKKKLRQLHKTKNKKR